MSMKFKPIFAAVLLLSAGLARADDLDTAADASASASAAAKSASAAHASSAVQFRVNGQDFQIGDPFASAFSHPMDRAVKNAPYSAEVINESTQTLADGNQITNRASSLVYRDAAGRTRQEVRDAKGELKLININDVTDGSRMLITPSSKSLQKFTQDKDFAERMEKIRERTEAARQTAEKYAKEARERHGNKTVDVTRGPNGEEITTIRSEKVGKDGKVEKREETVMRIVRVGDAADGQKREVTIQIPAAPPVPPVAPVPPAAPAAPVAPVASVAPLGPMIGIAELMRLPAIHNAFNDRQWRKNATTTDLGSRDFDGVKATGKRTSYSIPAGEVGNKNPIVVSSEVWTSAELSLTVYAKYSDPRSGETVYRLANLKRAEPPASLFAAPEGYTVREIKTPGGASREFRFEGRNKDGKAEVKSEK